MAAARLEPLGSGEGFVGALARIHLEIEGTAPDAPRSVVAKLPTTVRENRATGELLGAYEREICFYRELGAHVPLRTPRLYHADLDPNPGSRYGAAIVGFVDRLPFWLIRALMAVFRWIAQRSRRRYVLVLEDLEPARVGDQVGGASPETCAAVLSALARSHAAFWRSPRLDAWWIGRGEIATRIAQQVYEDTRRAFALRYASLVTPRAEAAFAWLDAHGSALLRALHDEAPPTLLHGDFRLDNLFFGSDGPGEPIAVDWQGAARGPGVYDVAYFLSGSLDAAVPRETERALVRGYHQALLATGVRDYTLEACERDYARSLYAMLHRIVSVEILDMGEARGIDLMAVWAERLLRRVEDVDAAGLLALPR